MKGGDQRGAAGRPDVRHGSPLNFVPERHAYGSGAAATVESLVCHISVLSPLIYAATYNRILGKIEARERPSINPNPLG